MLENFTTYFKSLQDQNIADITEHSHRGVLETLLKSVADKSIKILHEPKREGKFGSPDFKVTCSESIVGYIENKKINENLDKILKSEQIKKYQSLSDNLLLTNYIEWIWIKDQKILKKETLCFLTDVENKRGKLDKAKVEAVETLLKAFFSQSPKQIGDAKKLANALAVRAKILKEFLFEELERQKKEHNEGRLYSLFEVFKKYVFHDIKSENYTSTDFADTFSQNLVYSLFLAKLNAGSNPVALDTAKRYIPVSFELIRELVGFLDELNNKEYQETKWIVEEVLTILNNINLGEIQKSLSTTNRKKDSDGFLIKDPYVYFYEDFLAAYDKKLRKAKGVYYTPPAVVNFIVRAIDDILIKTFGIKEGLADHKKVTVLDFATGTGTFLLEVFQQIFNKLPQKSGKKNSLIKEHLLKNMYGFEYLIAPYTIAHLKLSQFLKDNGYDLENNERLQIYLTNTLEPLEKQEKVPFLPALTEESKQAQEIKDKKILVITGNPPYSKKSKNNGAWIKNLVEDYKIVDGKHFGEKQNWFRDDYVKFIRFAQNKMDEVEEGVVGVITNHSFLDNITFPGMRRSLLNTFDQLYFVNLHGSVKKEEGIPDEIDKDENVFDKIEQGVAVSIFVKKKGLDKKCFYTDFWGRRIDKYSRSLEESLKTISWIDLTPKSPSYYFVPKNDINTESYNQFLSVKDIFKVFSLPLMTGNDEITMHFNEKTLIQALNLFEEESPENLRQLYRIEKESSNWTVKKAKKDVIKTGSFSENIRICLYRPFDTRFTYFTGNSSGFHSRPGTVSKNMLYENIGLLLPRQLSKQEFRHVFCTNLIPEMCVISSATKEANQLFPLYLYESEDKKEPNFTDSFIEKYKKLYGSRVSPEKIMGYIYGVLHAPAYREKYIEQLKTGFPRIPFTEDKKLFEKLSDLGFELIQAHLLEKEFDSQYGELIGSGNNIVKAPRFVEGKKLGKIYINETQYFENVPKSVWEFHIGGFQVIDRYLKYRKDRVLGLEEIENVAKIVQSLAFTIDQMKKIDKLTNGWI